MLRSSPIKLLLLSSAILLSATLTPLFKSSYKNTLDCVVRLDVWENNFDQGKKIIQRGIGSGTIMSKDGYILTNAHVASIYAQKILVTLPSLQRVEAQFIGWDHWTDLAVVKIKDSEISKYNLNLKTASFGDSSQLQLGDTVYAMGTPFGLTRTLTKGIISNNRRQLDSEKESQLYSINGFESGGFHNWLQTDAAINPGNSGGCLTTQSGHVIGVNTLGVPLANNLGFAVPSSTAQPVMQELIAKGDVTRSSIGIQPKPLQDVEEDSTKPINGLFIQNVDEGSPAKTSGLLPGDIILSINNQSIDGRFPEQIPPIMHKIASFPIGSQLSLLIQRGSSQSTVLVTTEKLESRVGEKLSLDDWGISLQKLTKKIAREKRLPSQNGFLIIGKQPGSPADYCGLQDFDIILKINDQPLSSSAHLLSLYQQLKPLNQNIILEIFRNYKITYIVLKK